MRDSLLPPRPRWLADAAAFRSRAPTPTVHTVGPPRPITAAPGKGFNIVGRPWLLVSVIFTVLITPVVAPKVFPAGTGWLDSAGLHWALEPKQTRGLGCANWTVPQWLPMQGARLQRFLPP